MTLKEQLEVLDGDMLVQVAYKFGTYYTGTVEEGLRKIHPSILGKKVTKLEATIFAPFGESGYTIEIVEGE